MRPRRVLLAVVLILAFVLARPPKSAASVPELDSPSRQPTASDSAAAPSEAPAAVMTGPAGESTLTAVRVEPSSLGFVKVVHADGTEEFLASQKIRWILDANGRDRTSLVLDRGRSFGDLPVSIRFTGARPDRSSLRGRPLPFRRTFPVIQVGILARLDRERAYSRQPPAWEEKSQSIGQPVSLVIDIGAMKNLNPRWGAGGSLFYAGDQDFVRLGAKMRLRRWIRPTVSIDAAPGLLFGENSNQLAGRFLPGFVGELGLSLGDWVSVTGQMEAARREDTFRYVKPLPLNPNNVALGSRDRTEVSWYLGGKLGGDAAIGAMAGALLLGLLVSRATGTQL